MVDLSDLGLEAVGLDPEARNIQVDDRMRAADGIWAMGDVTGQPSLTHVAEYHSAIIAAQILGQDHPPARYRGFIKLVADRAAGVLVGATVVGPRGTDVLGLLNLAVHARVPVAELKTMVYAFPSHYGAIGEALGVRRGLTTVLEPDYHGAEDLSF